MNTSVMLACWCDDDLPLFITYEPSAGAGLSGERAVPKKREETASSGQREASGRRILAAKHAVTVRVVLRMVWPLSGRLPLYRLADASEVNRRLRQKRPCDKRRFGPVRTNDALRFGVPNLLTADVIVKKVNGPIFWRS